ncbi:hypothetical protein A2774_03095 [Candidatus Roizmanbacteria bacterium RIFCSPHIGHO2_01_FULL_39_12c]|uniref:Haloacid dehalogenase n=1 Tax=Candidatus Roizmanbacteria bacterium RIFCSPHIGHO2_01_FULL_39_12c TaxID=1802031 RepID=A0A1F7GC52_9BACT|nr:MAG: hypothetical protein A2774_03095 [Candidatus Roizmanbacteria bacterium RIFCSPHIGHO2_01_FULL_39_12c]OGK47414.1 MAG: hypothetical protein A2963_04645 [Candidatus Roizmanbacteria bacterium RIFCSPLOWO2_01_FULL_40_13]
MLILGGRNIRGLAFDLEGTIINLEPVHHHAHLSIAKSVGLVLPELDQIGKIVTLLPHFIGGPREAIAQEIFELSNKKVSVADLVAADLAAYNQLLQDWTDFRPRDGFSDFLDEVFRQKDLTVAIGSLTPRGEARTVLKKSGLLDLINPNRIILREDVDKLKPHPDVFLTTAERMKIHPSEQLVFEDSPKGIAAAVAAGSLAIGMPIYDNEIVWKQLRDAGALTIFKNWNGVSLQNLTLNEGSSFKRRI